MLRGEEEHAAAVLDGGGECRVLLGSMTCATHTTVEGPSVIMYFRERRQIGVRGLEYNITHMSIVMKMTSTTCTTMCLLPF